MNVGIIGGGASGMMAAIRAAQNGHSVTILEHMGRVGKKILSTGSGRCNLSNTDMDISHFHGGNQKLISHILDAFSKDDTLSFFSKSGLYTTNKNGYLYPYCEQASSVLDMFLSALKHSNVQIVTDCEILSVKPTNIRNIKGFTVSTSMGDYTFDKLILAAGSKAAPKTGSDGSGYMIAKSLGHSILKPLPALCGLKCSEGFFKSLAGIRCKASVSLYANDEFLGCDKGEIQLNKYGISGIPVMQLSYLAAKSLDDKKKVTAQISFMHEFDASSLYGYLKARISSNPDFSAGELFLTILNKNITSVLLKECNISRDLSCSDLSEKQLKLLSDKVTCFKVNIVGTNSFDEAQVCSGGVSLDEVDDNMQSRLVPGLYFAGEILDVNGDCGGYNLQWAFSSGYVAGSLENA